MSAIEKLKAWCAALIAANPNESQTSIAKRLGIPQPTLSRILAETKDVGRDVAIAIERETDGHIAIEEWHGYAPAKRGEPAAPKAPSESGEHPAISEEHAS